MATTYQDFNQARAILADKVGEVAWQLPINAVIGILNELLGFGLGVQTGKSGVGADVGYEVGKNLIPTVPMGESTEATVEAISPTIDFLNKPFELAGKGVEALSGSKMAGAATEALTGWFFPKAILDGLSTLKPPRSALGESLGKHVDIDLRPRNDMLSEGIGKAASVIHGQRVNPSFYGSGPFDRPWSMVDSSIRATGSVIQSILNPKADAILKKHGLSPASIKRINDYRALLNRAENPSGWEGSKMPTQDQIIHAEKVMIAELRKAFGMRLKSGKKVSPELVRVVEQYHPRLAVSDGIPTLDQMRYVLKSNVPDQYLAPLVDDMARTMVGDRPNIVALDGNPSQVAMSGVAKRGRIYGENTTELFTRGDTTYNMMGELWANLMAGKRFNPDLKNVTKDSFKSPGQRGYDEIVAKYPDQGFNEETIKQFFKIKARMARVNAKGKHNINIYSEGLKPKMIDIDGQDFLLYRVVSQSDNPLLANTPATIMLNPRNGVSRILQYDELDIFGGRVKAVSETGYKKRFHTVNYGKHVYDDGKLNRAGVGKELKSEPIRFTPVDRKVREANIDKIYETPYVGDTIQRGFIPVAAITTEESRKKKDANSQARNIY